MAQVTSGLIQQVKIDNSANQNIASTAYGECSTAASEAAKTVSLNGFELIKGTTIHVKFINANTASTAPTLNVNETGAKSIVQYGTTSAGTNAETNGWQPGAVLSLTYDGTNWVRDQGYNTNSTYTHPTSEGNKHIPTGGSSGQFLGWDSAGTAKWVNNPDTNTHRPIQLEGTEILGNNTTALNFKKGSNINITNSNGTVTIANTYSYTLPLATYNVLGGLKPAYSSTGAATLTTAAAANTDTPTIVARTTTSGRYYAVESDKNGIAYVNVPWTDHYAWGDITGKPTKITLTGAVTGSVSLSSGELSLATSVNHNHNASYLTAVGYDSTNKKLYYTKNGSNTDIVTVATLKTALGSMPPSAHDHNRLDSIGRLSTAATIAYNPGASQGFRLVWNIYDSNSRTNDAANSPSFDAGVINIPWDWGGYNSQIAISNTVRDNTRMQIRSASHTDNGENANPRYTPNYGAWREIVTAPKATQVGSTTKPIYISNTGQVLEGTALSDGAYKSILNNTTVGALGWNSAGSANANNLRLINVNTLAYWNGAYSGVNSNISIVGTIVHGTWHGTKIANDYIANPKVTIAGNDVSLGGSLAASTLVTSLGLSKAMRFIGVATVAITDGSTTDPVISGYSTKTAGDVIIDKDSSREYVWSTTNKWELLGGDSSYKTTQSTVDSGAAATNKWVSRIQQDANGVVTATMGTLDTSGTWSGNAATATTATNANYLISNTRMDYGWNGINYFNLSAARSTAIKNNQTPYASATWTHILRFNHANNAGYYTDLAIPFNGNSVWYRRIANGTLQNASYDSNTGWVELLDAINYTDYTVTKTGTGASGSWGISVTGSSGSCTGLAAKATADADGNTISSTYLKLSGGTMTGNIRRYYSSTSTEPMITALANNADIYLFQLGHGTVAQTTLSDNGYKLLYKGTNSSTNNYLQLIATQPNGTETIATQIDEVGNIILNATTASTSTTTGALLINGGAGIGGRITAQEINATRPMIISAGKVYSNISGSNVQLPAKTSMLFSNGIAFAHPALNPSNDVGWLRMLGTSESDAVFEIATGDDGGTSTGEKIVVRQYNTSNAIAKEAILLDKQTGATTFPTSISTPIYYGQEGNTHVRLTKANLVTTSTIMVGANTALTTSTADAEWLKCLLREICATYKGESGLFKGFMSPNSNGYFEVYIYNTSTVDSTTGLPQYSYGTYTKYSSAHYIFGTSAYSPFCYSFVKNDSGTWGISISGNAATATKLSNTPNNTTTFLRGDNTWSNEISGGLLKITNHGNTVTIGSANNDWCHFTNSANIPFYFNKAVHVDGDIYYYNTKVHMSSSGFHPPKNGGIYWDPYVESKSDASDVSEIVQVSSGAAGGTELRIRQANDSTDIINLMAPNYIYLNSKKAFTINDKWLRINDGGGFTDGIYCGSSLLRTDGQIQVGSSGTNFYANSSGNGYFKNTLGIAGTNTNYKLYVKGTTAIEGNLIFPTANIFDWNQGTYRQRLVITDDSTANTAVFTFQQSSNSGSSYQDLLVIRDNGAVYADAIYGAVWNDYAEYRESIVSTPGTCVVENDNGILSISDERLTPGASIISDTYGFSQGETERAQTPIAVSGRVLAYTYMPREMYHAGMAVCSAPGGTIDAMTREEIRNYPDAIIGIVSEIPDYEEWGTNNIKVDGRIWIKVRY